MLTFARLAIPITEACNQSCEYCYKAQSTYKTDAFTPTPLFFEYLKQLNYKTKNVCITGGEPLLNIPLMKKIIETLPHGIQRKVTTNGTRLTEDLVDYFNDTDTTVHISHDGKRTLLSRGVDIFQDPDILKCVKRIKNLMVYYTVNRLTYTGESISDYIAEVLDRDDFTPTLGMDLYSKYSLMEDCIVNGVMFSEKYQRQSKPLTNTVREPRKYPIRVNVLPSGEIYSLTGKVHFGSVNQTQEAFDYKIEYTPYPDYDYCKHNTKCRIRSKCEWTFTSNPLFCQYQEMILNHHPRIVYI